MNVKTTLETSELEKATLETSELEKATLETSELEQTTLEASELDNIKSLGEVIDGKRHGRGEWIYPGGINCSTQIRL